MAYLPLTETLLLRPLRPEDAIPMAALANNPLISNQLRDYFPHPYTVEDAQAFIHWTLEQEGEVTHTFAIEGQGILTGVCGLIPGADVHRFSAEIGYWLGEPFWGQGIATVVADALARYAFDALGLLRVHAYVFATNPASARVLEKAGFQYEGNMRRYAVKHDQALDVWLYARLK